MAFSYLKQLDQYSYELAPKQFPHKEDIEIYEGDEISITLKGIHLNSNRDPFNFDTFDEFKACFSRGPESETFCASSSDLTLGQSQDAINFDNNNNNPPGTTKDELHFVDDDYSILSDYNDLFALLDIQGKMNDSIYTFMKFKVRIEQQITK